jgi:hypothetical protein
LRPTRRRRPDLGSARRPFVLATLPTIGYLTPGGCPTAANIPLFLEGLQEKWYVVGQNLVFECRQTEAVSDEIFRQFAAELVRLNVALIFVGS